MCIPRPGTWFVIRLIRSMGPNASTADYADVRAGYQEQVSARSERKGAGKWCRGFTGRRARFMIPHA